MVFTAEDLTRLENLFLALKAEDGGDGRRRTDRRPGYAFVILNLQARRLARRISLLTSQIADLQIFDRETSKKIEMIGDMQRDAVQTISSLQFNVNMLMRPDRVSQAVGLLWAPVTGIAQGMEAAQWTLATRERIGKGYIKFGTREDEEQYARQMTGRIVLSFFGVRTW